MLQLLTDPHAWLSLLVLTVMEIVLGIDNIVFITILTGRLPREKQVSARRVGLAVALMTRILLLLSITWVMHLKDTLFVLVVPWNGKDLILAGGGLFLLYKATKEIYENVEHAEDAHDAPEGPGISAGKRVSYTAIILQIMLLDIVFSLDSVITAVGMAEHVPIMVAAMLIAVGVMMWFARAIGDFVQDHPSVRVLALAFLVLIGVMLIIEGTGGDVAKGYLYAAMGFSLVVQLLNIRMEARRKAQAAAAKSGS